MSQIITRPCVGAIVGFVVGSIIQKYPASGLIASRMALATAGLWAGLFEGIGTEISSGAKGLSRLINPYNAMVDMARQLIGLPEEKEKSKSKLASTVAFVTAISVNFCISPFFGSFISLSNVMITGAANYLAIKAIHYII